MTKRITIALDAMGGDHGMSVVLPAAVQVLSHRDDLDLLLVGEQDSILRELNKLGQADNEHLSIQHASQLVDMDELASHALRHKKDSSMRVAINMVKEGRALGCVSAGNTGALMSTARFVLKTLPGIDRPAICTALPNRSTHTWMLDLGANVDSSSEHLLQFAVMGSELATAVDGTAVDGTAHPRVGLLNIGEEEIKGNETVKEAALLMSDSPLNYVGFVEGDDVFSGVVDVVVCDGFVGNIALKSIEGVAGLISHFIKHEFKRNLLTKMSAVVAMPVLKAFRKRIDPRRYNGASLLGLRGTVVKSHGGTDVLGYANAIEVAAKAIKQQVPEHINSRLQDILAERQAS
jgi:glycerol-3-phosphate acyltransferase PlsX